MQLAGRGEAWQTSENRQIIGLGDSERGDGREALLGGVKGSQLGITDCASLLVKRHSVVGRISLYKRFLLNLTSYPR
jgi:hypothetical protein